ncbi:MAG TPA: two-component regulator propeller domain-containing protein [Vicinamibacterales bacterium]|nr:two-component regulator propeller domain-containing protein [Vicinamibacterales bacterium]
MVKVRLRAWITVSALLAATAWIAAPAYADWASVPSQLRFRRLSVEQGLSASVVRVVKQDHKGFLWIGTQDGLNMYDGFRVTVFKHEPENDNSLPGSYVTSLAESVVDGRSTLWVGTFRGLAAFETATGRIRRFRHDPADRDSLTHDAVQALHVGSDGVIWVGTSDGLNRVEPSSGRLTRVWGGNAAGDQPGQDFVTTIAEDRDGHLWIGTATGLRRMDRRTFAVERFDHDPRNPASVNHPYIRTLLIDARGRLWVGTDRGGLDRFDRDTRTFIHHVSTNQPGSITSNAVNAVLQDTAGDIWVGLWGGGINRLVERGGAVTFESFRHDAADPLSLANDDVTVLAEDRSGVIWVGTYGGGISGFAPAHARRFPYHKTIATDPGSLADDRVQALLVDRYRTLWVGTWGGLSRLRHGEERFVRLVHDPADPRSLSDNRVNDLAEGPDGALWVATMDGGVNRIDPVTGRITRFQQPRTLRGPAAGDRVFGVHVDRHGVVWTGTLYNGLQRMEPDGSITIFQPVAGDDGSLPDLRVNRVFEDSRGLLWVATHGGLAFFERQTGRFVRVHDMPGAPVALGRPVADVTESGGVIWAGTTEGGLVRVALSDDRSSAQFRAYREKDGLANDRIYRVLPDADGRLWITTDNGMTMLEADGQRMRRFDAAQGLQSNQFLSGGFFDRPTGTMFVGGIKGFNRFRPAALGPEAPVVPVVLTEFLVANQRVEIGDPGMAERIADAHQVRLPYAAHMFSLEFAALDFAAPEKTTYVYMLEGFDEQWNHTTASRRFVTYTSLSPGRYVFRVRAANSDGVWTPQPLALTVIIDPPFWMTWWFRTLLIVTIVTGVALGVRARLSSLERQRRTLEREVEARTAELLQEKQKVTVALQQAEQANAAKTTFLANISHEMRTPLAALVGLADVLSDTRLDEDQREYVRALSAAGEALSELVDDTLDLRKIELERLELENITFDLRRLLSDAIDVLRIRAVQKGLDLSCAIGAEVPREITGDPRALRRVLLNLLANAVKFTERGSVSLEVRRVGHAAGAPLEFTVRDTGIGIDRAKHAMIFETFVQADASTARRYGGSGLGLALCRQLVELMGGRIWVESEPGVGSRFHFTLPAREAAAGVEPALAFETVDASRVRPLRILVVEDAPQNRLLMSAYLNGDQDEVDLVETGELGVEAFKRGHYDIVLMDVNLPGIDGYAAAAQIRRIEADEGRRPCALIALTAYAFAEDAERSRAAGCDEHLTKPIRKAVLLEMLNRYRTADAA